VSPVCVTPATKVTGVSSSSASSSGVTVYLTRTDTGATNVRWQAMY
jgi:hypothetical protein